jgi:hypothetical protein
MALGLQAFLVSYRAFNTTIGIIANTTSDMAYRDRLLAAWSDNPDKTVMAMIFFLREIQNGQISPRAYPIIQKNRHFNQIMIQAR